MKSFEKVALKKLLKDVKRLSFDDLKYLKENLDTIPIFENIKNLSPDLFEAFRDELEKMLKEKKED